jgi:hypothetical protein
MKTNLIGLVSVILLTLATVACAQQRRDYFQSSVNLPGFHREVLETPGQKVVIDYDHNTAEVNGQPARLVVVQPVQPMYNRYGNGYTSGPYYPDNIRPMATSGIMVRETSQMSSQYRTFDNGKGNFSSWSRQGTRTVSTWNLNNDPRNWGTKTTTPIFEGGFHAEWNQNSSRKYRKEKFVPNQAR